MIWEYIFLLYFIKEEFPLNKISEWYLKVNKEKGAIPITFNEN